MLAKPRWDIEKKILVPFLVISILATVSFGAILYYSGYTAKTIQETEVARSVIGYIEEDMAYLYELGGEQAVVDKYSATDMKNVVIRDRNGTLITAPTMQFQDSIQVVLASDNNPVEWQITYLIDRSAFFSDLIEEQKYIILATIALLLVIVQSSILIAGNISTPLRRLSGACRIISEKPEEALDVDLQYAYRKDEIGQLARSFGRMLGDIQSYTADIVRVKNLNQTIVESLPIAVLAYDNAKNEVLMNGAAKNLLAKIEFTCEGKTLAQLLEENIENPELFYDPIHFESAEQRSLDIELGIWQLTDERQEPWGVLCTMDDVTYKKLLEKRTQQDEKLVYAGKLAASLAHEIRNPLAGIRASVQVVEKRLERPLDKTLCESIIGEVDRVNLLVENLVDLTRRRELKKSLIDISAFFEELVLLYTKVADNSHITISVDVRQGTFLYADEAAMKQIFINLINNSIKAIQHNGIITLKGYRTDDELILIVEDNGRGMSAAQLERLNTANKPGDHGGLGVSIVTQLLGQNGGTLQWSSILDKGTKAVITFQR